jgi:hypothetical protein
MHWIAPSKKDTANGTLKRRLWVSADRFHASSGLKSQDYFATLRSRRGRSTDQSAASVCHMIL